MSACMCTYCVGARSLNNPPQTMKERIQAEQRGKELLLDHLTEEQRKTWTQDGYFEFKGSDGHIYQLFMDGGANVLDTTSRRRIWVQPAMPVVDGDRFLSQKLWLERDATGMKRISCA